MGRRTGITTNCIICGDEYYRSAHFIKRGIRKTCAKAECKSASRSGANNPFWGRTHTADTVDLIKQKRAELQASGRIGKGGKKGYKHTAEARAKMSAALQERWQANRDEMIAKLRREPKPRELLRYRRNFNRTQRREWKADTCAWCGSTSKLVLDHIIPVMCGGENERRNAQTLCQPCNLWKMGHVDRPLFVAGLQAASGAKLNPE